MTTSTEKFVVIGSNSFSGSHFVARLLKEETEIVGISRSPEPSDVFLPYKWVSHANFSFHQLDINHHLENIMAVINDFRPDYVVNFAAQGMVAQSWTRPQDWFMTNTVSMVNLHDRLRKCDFIKKFVQISTPEVYGNTEGLVKEDAPYNPSTPYAVSKAACDMSLMTFFKAYQFPVVFTRASNVCGPGQQLYRILPRTILYALLGKRIKLEGGGQSVRSFIHIQDVVDGTLQVTRYAQPGNVYHLSTNKQITIRNLVDKVYGLMGVDFDDCADIAEGRQGQDSAYLLDSTKARNELGWTPERSLEETIAETIDWVKPHLDVLKRQLMSYVHKP